LARRLGHRTTRLPDVVAHALLIALIFALLLVPGAALHEKADSLTHAHVQLSIHSHGGTTAQSAPTIVDFVTHALGDGLEGQAVGLPLTVLALLVSASLKRRTEV